MKSRGVRDCAYLAAPAGAAKPTAISVAAAVAATILSIMAGVV